MTIRCNHSIYGICENCEGDLFEKALKHSGGHGQTDGEPIPQVALPESASAAQRAACEEQRQGTGNALSAAADDNGAQGSGEADTAALGEAWAAVLVSDAALEAGVHQLVVSLDLSPGLLDTLEEDGNLHSTAAAVYRAMVLASAIEAATAGETVQHGSTEGESAVGDSRDAHT